MSERPLVRSRRQAGDLQPALPLVPIEPVAPAPAPPAQPAIILNTITPVEPAPATQPAIILNTITPVEPQPVASEQQIMKYEQNIQREENRMTIMLRNMMNSKYTPTREQVIQLATTVLTLMLMLALGPVMGANAGLIQSIVKQAVPFIVSYGVHYAADQAIPPPQIADSSPVTSVQLEPVAVPKSVFGQTV